MNWPIAPLAQISNVFDDGDWIETKDQAADGIRLIQTGNVGEGTFKDRRDKARFVSEETFYRLNCTEVFSGDVLISRLPDPVGRSCIIPETGDKMITAVDCTIVRPDHTRLDPRFLVYYTQTSTYSRDIEAQCTGTTRKRISRSNLGAISFPLPPVEEQKRIVAVLDQAFAALNRARANAEANLEETEDLFQNSLLTVFDNLAPTSELMTLAEASADFSRGKSRHRPRNDPSLYDGDFPFIQTGDIRRSVGSIREFSQTYNEKGLAQSKLWPAGTVCITIAANIAETGVLEFEGCFPDSVIGMVPDPKIAKPYYVEYMLRYFAEELKAQGKGSAFEKARFPFPPLEAQNMIVEQLDEISNGASALRNGYLEKLSDLDDLRQSLLQRAFAGELN